MTRILFFLLVLLSFQAWADVTRNSGDDTWLDLSDYVTPFETATQTITDGADLLVAVFHGYKVTDPVFTLRWGGSGGTIMTEEVGVGGEGVQRIHIFTLANPTTVETNSETFYMSWTSGDLSSDGVDFFFTTFEGVDTSTPVVDAEGNSNFGTGATILVPSAGSFADGDSGDLIFGYGGAWQVQATVTGNGQTRIGTGNIYNDAAGDAFYKAWGGGSGDDLEFGSSDADYAGAAGIVINAAAAAGPSAALLRRRGR